MKWNNGDFQFTLSKFHDALKTSHKQFATVVQIIKIKAH